jgi:hypothetical protein
MIRFRTAIFTLVLFGTALGAGAADTAAEAAAPDCSGIADIKSKSRQSFDGSTLMVSLLMLEKQGEADFTPKFAPPSSVCVFDKFDAGGLPVSALYSPFEKGEQTLHYRFVAHGDEMREILVVYDGPASLVAKKDLLFVVVEKLKENVSYYAMFRDQPAYAALKPLIVSILDGSAKPLAIVRWPAGAKEPVIDAYDTKRLK